MIFFLGRNVVSQEVKTTKSSILVGIDHVAAKLQAIPIYSSCCFLT